MNALRLFCSVLLLAAVLPTAAGADCSPAGGVMMNEVRYYDISSPDGSGEHLHAFVELYNKDTLAVDITGWTITTVDGPLETVATIPAVDLPSGAHLTVWFGTGADDLDFSDGIGQIWTNGDSVDVFDKSEDGIALYDDLSSIVDYMTYSENGVPPVGTALTDAEIAGVWAVGDVIPSQNTTQSTWRLLPDGYDFHGAEDWHSYGWGESYFGANVLGSNSLAISPDNGGGFEADSLVALTWGRPSLNPDLYNLKVATDSSMTAVILDVNTTGTDTTLSLSEGSYYWQVSLIDTCGTLDGEVRVLDVFALSNAPGVTGLADLTYAPTSRFLQHKDTKLLCIYDNKLAGNARGGCLLNIGSQGPWDTAHPNNHANYSFVAGNRIIKASCRHCNQYCGRAGIQMINQKFGGNLSQDRISYAFMVLDGATDPSPEGDLGHDLPALLGDADNVLQWAVKNTTVTGPLNVTFAALKAQIDLGFPALVTIPNHFMVVDAYIEKGTWNNGKPDHDMVRIRDPWPGSRGWTRYSTSNLNNYYRMRLSGATAAAGRMQEATVTTDTDGDGMMDFDEGAPNYPADRPRRFDSKHTTPDTDLDEVTDKVEVKAYTFYSCGDNDAISFPDVDGDGVRAEGDCDSDHKVGTGCFDGGEDIHNTGFCLDRSDPFNPADDVIFAVTDKFAYQVGETVKMGGQYVHADTTYPVDIMLGCPSLVDGQPIGADVTLASNNGGVMPLQDITVCGGPGLYLGVVDILRNSLCERGPCHNPDVCWMCLIPTFDGDDDDTTTDWEDPTGTNNNPSGAFWQGVPDNWFEFTGTSWGIDAFWQPTQPVDAMLVTKPIQTLTQGDVVFLSYDHLFFGLGGMQGVVLLSTDGGSSWNPIMNFPPGDHGGTETIEITGYLSPPSSAHGLTETAMGPDIQVAFHAMSPPGGGAWFVDNVWVGEAPLAQVGVPKEPELPTEMILAPNYPNPFRAQTTIRFALPAEPGRVTVEILDINGRRINRLLDGTLPPGPNEITWDGKDALGRQVAAGIYFYRLKSNHGVETRKMTLLN